MNYSNFKTDWNKPSKFIAEHYGTKVTVEYDHSDLSFDEVMDAFETLVVGMGYHKDAWKEWILDRADEYREEDAEEKINQPYTYEQFKKDCGVKSLEWRVSTKNPDSKIAYAESPQGTVFRNIEKTNVKDKCFIIVNGGETNPDLEGSLWLVNAGGKIYDNF